MITKENPSFNPEYANRVSKADFVKHFTEPVVVYPNLSVDELGSAWESLQEKKEAPKKAEAKAESK